MDELSLWSNIRRRVKASTNRSGSFNCI